MVFGRRFIPPPRALKEKGKMANTSSAKKAVRKIERRTSVNRARRSRMRTFVRKVEEALAAGDATLAAAALQTAAPVMMRAAQSGVIHKNTASRKVSRLTARVKALAANA
jgi:small subunit ribosomal protein S20